MPTGRMTVALAHLVVRPERPSYQARTVHRDFIEADTAFAIVEQRRRQDAAVRIDSMLSDIARDTVGTVHLPRGPIVAAGLVAIALGVGALLR